MRYGLIQLLGPKLENPADADGGQKDRFCLKSNISPWDMKMLGGGWEHRSGIGANIAVGCKCATGM